MRFVLNGDPLDVASDTTVGDLVDELVGGRSGVAVAVNGDVAPRSTWDQLLLVEGNEVELLSAAQGG